MKSMQDYVNGLIEDAVRGTAPQEHLELMLTPAVAHRGGDARDQLIHVMRGARLMFTVETLFDHDGFKVDHETKRARARRVDYADGQALQRFLDGVAAQADAARAELRGAAA